jgi:hypothetical protein
VFLFINLEIAELSEMCVFVGKAKAEKNQLRNFPSYFTAVGGTRIATNV